MQEILYSYRKNTGVKILMNSDTAVFSSTHPDMHCTERTGVPGLE